MATLSSRWTCALLLALCLGAGAVHAEKYFIKAARKEKIERLFTRAFNDKGPLKTDEHQKLYFEGEELSSNQAKKMRRFKVTWKEQTKKVGIFETTLDNVLRTCPAGKVAAAAAPAAFASLRAAVEKDHFKKELCELDGKQQLPGGGNKFFCHLKQNKEYGVLFAKHAGGDVSGELEAIKLLRSHGLSTIGTDLVAFQVKCLTQAGAPADGYCNAYLVHYIDGIEISPKVSDQELKQTVAPKLASLGSAQKEKLKADVEALRTFMVKCNIVDLQGFVDKASGHFLVIDPMAVVDGKSYSGPVFLNEVLKLSGLPAPQDDEEDMSAFED